MQGTGPGKPVDVVQLTAWEPLHAYGTSIAVPRKRSKVRRIFILLFFFRVGRRSREELPSDQQRRINYHARNLRELPYRYHATVSEAKMKRATAQPDTRDTGLQLNDLN